MTSDTFVRDEHHRFEVAQISVGAPVLGELDGRPGQLVGMLLELGFEPFEQSEGVGGGASEASYDVAFLADAADLAGVRLHEVWPRLTWPSPAITTLPPLRTVTMVVACMVNSFDMFLLRFRAAPGRLPARVREENPYVCEALRNAIGWRSGFQQRLSSAGAFSRRHGGFLSLTLRMRTFCP